MITVMRGADQVVTGIVLNIFALALAAVLLSAIVCVSEPGASTHEHGRVSCALSEYVAFCRASAVHAEARRLFRLPAGTGFLAGAGPLRVGVLTLKPSARTLKLSIVQESMCGRSACRPRLSAALWLASRVRQSR